MKLYDLPQNLQRTRYYLENLSALLTPRAVYQRRLPALLAEPPDAEMRERIDYCHPVRDPFDPGPGARPFRLDLRDKRSTYQLDFYQSLRYFDADARVNTLFGDNILEPDTPAFVKTRPIGIEASKGILLKLNQVRHFYFVRDHLPFETKQNRLVWRGNAHQPHRKAFLERFLDHPRCDIGHHHKRPSPVAAWNKGPLSVARQLRSKFILALEGNDVATSLKWILSSNSLCFMPKPRYESWFMEGRLQAGVHYVELAPDFSDLDEKIDYYSRENAAALEIIRNANAWVDRFRDPRRERLISLHVADRYLRLSGQRQD